MIHFSLRCDRDHSFDGWFRDSSAFEEQASAGEIACPECGSTGVSKAIMAPRVVGSRSDERATITAAAAPGKSGLLDKMRAFRRYVESHADYVGDRFAEEARRIHNEETSPRGIYGKASVEDAVSLSEEGIEVFPLPVLPEDKN